MSATSLPTPNASPGTAGGRFFCKQCGKESLAAAKTRYDGWTRIVEWHCAFCGTPAPGTGSATPSDATAPENDRARQAAEALLGERLQAPARFAAEDGDGRFCKYCRHFLLHPFQCRCQYWKRPVEPMQDCPQFERKSESNSGT